VKLFARRVSTVVATLTLCTVLAAPAIARPRDTRDPNIPTRIIKIIKMMFGLGSQDEQLIPPRPTP